MNRCPTCGGPVKPLRHLVESDELYDLLMNGTPHREVYHGQAGGWWLTYGGGEVSPHAVRDLLGRGIIQSVYSDCPNEAYHVGKTLDIQATLEERKKHRRAKDALRIYTDGSREPAESGRGR